jgi:hypothetical protein
MFATLALTLLIAKPKMPAMSPEMVSQISIASQNYGGPPVPVSQLSGATGMYMAPTDDIWVYANAQDPQKDEYLRAWGSNGHAIPIPGDDPQASSWSLLKWDLSGYGPNTKIVEAQLILYAAPDAGYTPKDAAEAPIEVRAVKPGFSESKWTYSDAEHYMPTGTEADIFGETAPATVDPAGFRIVIDLLHGPADFKDYFNKAMKKDKVFALAVTSRIDPSKVGREGIYKFYSKDTGDPTMRPALRIVIDDSKPDKKKKK